MSKYVFYTKTLRIITSCAKSSASLRTLHNARRFPLLHDVLRYALDIAQQQLCEMSVQKLRFCPATSHSRRALAEILKNSFRSLREI